MLQVECDHQFSFDKPLVYSETPICNNILIVGKSILVMGHLKAL